MDIKRQAIIKTAKVTALTVSAVTSFAFLLVYLPWVALAVVIAAMIYFVYQYVLLDLKSEEQRRKTDELLEEQRRKIYESIETLKTTTK